MADLKSEVAETLCKSVPNDFCKRGKQSTKTEKFVAEKKDGEMLYTCLL